jgi:hypothetical protein
MLYSIMNSAREKLRGIPRDFLLFLLAVSFLGLAGSMFDSTFNNFLNERFALSSSQRSFLELPREVPGFLVMFVSAMLFFMCNRTLASFAQIIAAVGLASMGLFSRNYSLMLMWLFVYSTGVHLFLPLNSDIGMELASGGNTGTRLGQLQGAGNLAAICGSLVVFVGFKFLGLGFKLTFITAAACYMAGFFLLNSMKKNCPVPLKTKFTFRREYRLYYWLAVLFGARKQIFITFAPWVLVTVFKQKTQTIAVLLTLGGIIGIFFKPFLGRAIDRICERTILAGEAFLLIFVCVGYGFAKRLLPVNVALVLTAVCFIADQLLISVGMARATYLKKIALNREELTSTLAMATTIDHCFSISIALIGGVIWRTAGYEYVFLVGGLIACVNLFSALRIKTGPKPAL